MFPTQQAASVSRISTRREALMILGLAVGINEPTEGEVEAAYRAKAASLHPDQAGGQQGGWSFEDLTFAKELLTGKATLKGRAQSHGRKTANLFPDEASKQSNKSYRRRQQFQGDTDKDAMSSIFGGMHEHGNENNRNTSNEAPPLSPSFNHALKTSSRELQLQEQKQEQNNIIQEPTTAHEYSTYVRRSGNVATSALLHNNSVEAHNEKVPPKEIDRSILWMTTAQKQMQQSATAAREGNGMPLRQHGRKSSMANAGAAMMANQGVHTGISRLCF